MENVNIFVVFFEGILSFFSPCILPILPIYLSMLSNSSVSSLKEDKNNFFKTSLFKNTLLFSLGISTTFFILGSSVRFLSHFFKENKYILMIAGGILIIIMGLFYIGVIKSSLLNREKRFNMEVKDMKGITAYILGFTFSFGWTPCIGPILSSVLIMVSTSSSKLTGNLLIVAYTLGFILPFIITAIFYSKLFKFIDSMKSNMNIIKKIGGIILIVSGIFMTFNGYFDYKKVQSNKNIQESNISDNEENNHENSNVNKDESEKNEYTKAIGFKLKDQYGKEHTLSEYKGKIIFLNFFATWCPPCMEEMPYIEEIYKEYGYNKKDIIILGLASPNNTGEKSEEEVIKFLKDKGYTFPVLMDGSGKTSYDYEINAFPTTIIINKKGEVTNYIQGGMTKDSMKDLIENQE